MKHYTIDETAAWLNCTPEMAFTFTTGKPRHAGKVMAILWPSAEFIDAVRIRRRKTTGNVRIYEGSHEDYGRDREWTVEEEKVTGFFEVCGDLRGGLLVWNESDRAIVCRIDGASVIGNCSINKSQLRISAECLKDYMEENGIPVPEEIRKEAMGENNIEPHAKKYPGRIYGDRNVSPEEYVKRRRMDAPPATNQNLAYELREEMSNLEIGRLFYPGDNSKNYLKNIVQKLFTKEAERLGTADELIKGRGKTP